MFLKTNTQENALTLRPYSFLELNYLLLHYLGYYFLLLFFFLFNWDTFIVFEAWISRPENTVNRHYKQ